MQSLHDRAFPYTYTLPQLTHAPHSAHPNPCKCYSSVTHRSQAGARDLREHRRSSDYTGKKKAAQLVGKLKHCKVTGKNKAQRIPDLGQASTRFSLEFQKAFRNAGALFSFHLE